MADIQEFPQLDELEQRLAALFKDSVQFALEEPELAAQVGPEGATASDIEVLSDEIRSIKLNEIIIFSSWANDNAIIGESILNLGFIFTVPEEIINDRDPAEIDTYLAARDLLSNIINTQDMDWDLFNEWFNGFEIDIAYLNNRDEFIIFKINITDSVQAYSLTKDLDITITEGEPEFIGGPTPTIVEESEAGARIEELEEPEELEQPEEPEKEIEEDIEEEVRPNDIIEYPDLNDLRLEFETSYRDSLLQLDDYDSDNFILERIIIDAPWGDGTADFSEDPLTANYIISTDLGTIQFRVFADNLSELIQDNFVTTDVMNEWFSDIHVDIFKSEDINLAQIVRATQGDRLFDIFNEQMLRVDNGNLIEDSLEEPEEEPEVPEIIEPEEPEEAIPDFPEVPDPLQQFAVSPDKIDFPVGKETKSVQPREIYDWESELSSPQGDLDGGIGEAKRTGEDENDPTFASGIPPGTFPRVGSYIKYHLLFEGPSYVLEMYNDLIVYSAFISTMHEGLFKPGTYNSFRAYLNRVRLIGERGGPQLINQLSPQQASARGLETVPDHPYIDDGKAPWLERRIYYEIVEENIDMDEWNDIVGAVSELTAE